MCIRDRAQILARVRDQLGDVDNRLARLESLVERLADVVGALTIHDRLDVETTADER